MKQVLLYGGNVVMQDEMYPLGILIDNGRIAGLFESGEALGKRDSIDGSQCVVLPGAIDGHSHLFEQDPEAGYFDAAAYEGFTNDGSGAASGGITTTVRPIALLTRSNPMPFTK